MTLYELLIIFFLGIAVLASAVGAWAKRREAIRTMKADTCMPAHRSGTDGTP